MAMNFDVPCQKATIYAPHYPGHSMCYLQQQSKTLQQLFNDLQTGMSLLIQCYGM